jgi:hypothetical protein
MPLRFDAALLASAAMIGVDLFCDPAGAQGVSQSASPTSQTRLAKPSRSRRPSDGSHVTETALIPDVVPHAALERRPRQRYEDWGDHVPMFLLHSVNSSHPKPGQSDLTVILRSPMLLRSPSGRSIVNGTVTEASGGRASPPRRRSPPCRRASSPPGGPSSRAWRAQRGEGARSCGSRP